MDRGTAKWGIPCNELSITHEFKSPFTINAFVEHAGLLKNLVKKMERYGEIVGDMDPSDAIAYEVSYTCSLLPLSTTRNVETEFWDITSRSDAESVIDVGLQKDLSMEDV